MLRQIILICIALMAMSYSANSQQSPPNSERAKQIETLVHKAAVMVEKEGKEAFIEFRKRGRMVVRRHLPLRLRSKS